MDCNETRRLLGAHLDEELDVVHDAAVAAHLETCPACSETALALMEQHRLLQEKLTRHRAPQDLAAQIRSALPPAARTVDKPRWTGAPLWSQLTALAACLLLGGLAGISWGTRHTQAEILLTELTAAHVRARVSGHAVDVESSDRHTVKPWFIGKVDFAPFVPDFADQGYPLLGGRLERVDGHTTATLVYGRRKHSIDLSMWSGAPAPVTGPAVRDGYSLHSWQAGGLNFAAVSDIAPEELAQFVSLVRAAGPR
ncbi:MAG: anti-sigma factor family protein [Opitutales bacterium]